MLVLSKKDLQLIVDLLDQEVEYAKTPLTTHAKKHREWVTELRDKLKRQQ